MEVSSYGGTSTESSGLVRILKDLSASIADEHVLLVEDIIDTGLTLNYLVRYLRGKSPPRSGSAPCSTSRPGAWSRSRSTTPASRSTTGSWSATGSTSASSTATCATSASSGRRSTAKRDLGDPGMTMHRRPLGAARLLAAVGAILDPHRLVPGLVHRGRRTAGLNPISATPHGRSTAGGILDFITALLVLALVALPYAIGDRPVAVDRGLSFLLLTVLGWLACLPSSTSPADLQRLRARPVAPGSRACGCRRSAYDHVAGDLPDQPRRRIRASRRAAWPLGPRSGRAALARSRSSARCRPVRTTGASS